MQIIFFDPHTASDDTLPNQVILPIRSFLNKMSHCSKKWRLDL